MVNKEQQEYTFVEVIGHSEEPRQEEPFDVSVLMKQIENYGEWKELIGFLKGKNLNPKLVQRYIEAVLEIDKLNV